MDSVQDLTFDNRFVSQLPADSESENFVREVRSACYSRVGPIQTSQPKLVTYSAEVADMLGFSRKFCHSVDFTQIFAGNKLLSGMDPFAMCYGGHQFGNWAGQLGDGRAIILGEIEGSNGQRNSLQLKGAGPTPYSRTADGLAVLRSSLREYVCSEAMAHLGVPTTRALSLVLTGDTVIRDMLYDGHPAPEKGAVVCRVSPSFVRFGNFEILAARRDLELLRQLADYTIANDFPELPQKSGPSKYVVWFEDVVLKTAQMIVDWMRLGFVHGVMNTDNMSILGLTIDYGPYGWLEDYDPNWTPNTTDAHTRRYRYGQQPAIAQWNLLQLANAIFPLVEEAKPLEDALNMYARLYGNLWSRALVQKLGLVNATEGDSDFFRELDESLLAAETDMTLFFRLLAKLDPAETVQSNDPVTNLLDAYYDPDALKGDARKKVNDWLKQYAQLVLHENRPSEMRVREMNAVNPIYVPRNYLAQLAIDGVDAGDYSFLEEWLSVLKSPYSEQPGREKFAQKRPEWARTRVGCSMLSCSS